jgi:hypothetical protein
MESNMELGIIKIQIMKNVKVNGLKEKEYVGCE